MIKVAKAVILVSFCATNSETGVGQASSARTDFQVD